MAHRRDPGRQHHHRRRALVHDRRAAHLRARFLGGDYTLELTVTADADTATTTAKVTVPTVPIFYQQAVFGAGSYDVAVGLMRSDGTGKHLVSCTANTDGGTQDINGYAFNTFHGVGAFDPPIGMKGRFAFSLTVGGADHQLLVAEEDSDCSTKAPPRVDDGSDAFYSTTGHFWPRFSPDGMRVLLVDNPEGKTKTSRLVSGAITGLSRRVVTGGNGNKNLGTAPPFWIDSPTSAACKTTARR